MHLLLTCAHTRHTPLYVCNPSHPAPLDHTHTHSPYRSLPLQVTLKPAEFYAGLGVTVHLGTEVTSVDAAGHVVHTTKGDFEYGKLLVATGGVARTFK
jgi:NADPH-dependent 2,4-dienoyl-CoA reductase/sulfur reductase-like enzyme